MLKNILMVGIGGAAGSILRYIISILMLPAMTATGFPFATMTINISGSLLIGILLSVLNSSTLYIFLAVGFCGGFTTFSTFALETVEMARIGSNSGAVLYILLNVFLSVAAVWTGMFLGTKIS